MHGVTNYLRLWRTRRQLTQAALAELCSCSVDTIRALEAGRVMRGPAAQRVADRVAGGDVDLLFEPAISPLRTHPRRRAMRAMPQPEEREAEADEDRDDHDDGVAWDLVERYGRRDEVTA